MRQKSKKRNEASGLTDDGTHLGRHVVQRIEIWINIRDEELGREGR